MESDGLGGNLWFLLDLSIVSVSSLNDVRNVDIIPLFTDNIIRINPWTVSVRVCAELSPDSISGLSYQCFIFIEGRDICLALGSFEFWVSGSLNISAKFVNLFAEYFKGVVSPRVPFGTKAAESQRRIWIILWENWKGHAL